MAIGVQLDFPGGRLKEYDEVIRLMGFQKGGPGGPGGLFHWVTKSNDGLRVTDVWKTKAAFEKFSNEKIGPLAQKAGLKPPEVKFFEVHNYLIAGPPE